MHNKVFYHNLKSLFKHSLKTVHGRFLLLGFLAGITFLPIWVRSIMKGLLHGYAAPLINIGFLYLGIHTLWQERQILKQMSSDPEDRLIGYGFILGGMAWLPFSQDSVSLQALLIAIILLGIAWSSFGLKFFWRYPSAALMILASIYPSYVFLSNTIWRFITGPYLLENFMARIGSFALWAIGQPATFENRFIFLAGKAAEVGSGCSGFDMAFAIAGCSFILGLFLKQNWPRIILAMTFGALLALMFNIPRIMLLTLAVAYWGEASFDFWHGAWGGQIFSTIMFTVYYYVAMAIYSKKPLHEKLKAN